MRFEKPSLVQEVAWRMREAEMERSRNRDLLNRLFNGEPPYTDAEAEENDVQVNRNFLQGVEILSDARRQWNQAMISSKNYFQVKLDSGPIHKRADYGNKITKAINRVLKKSRSKLEEQRATGANVMLHGIGPCNWKDQFDPIPAPLHVSSLLVPSETDLDFENLEHFAIRRQYTPSLLAERISDKKVAKGWNVPLVKAAIAQAVKDKNKDVLRDVDENPEKITELMKQDIGFWGSDAVSTVDVIDFYFREADDGDGWYRRVILDWNMATTGEKTAKPKRSWGSKDANPDEMFLYTSGDSPYAESLSEIIHCQFGDCAAVAPFKYHSVRSLGWLIWGVCDLMNRLDCRFIESVFENLMWFFRTNSQNDFNRIRKATFRHMGIVPNGVAFIPANERFIPNPNLIDMARGSLKAQLSAASASYTQDFDKGESRKEQTATETMARVNSVNALVAGMMSLAYSYEEFKDCETCRRFAIKDSPSKVVKKVQEECRKEGVPDELMDAERWEVIRERVIGGGNKTVEMAAIGFLQNIRGNLGPDAQRKIDHISISSATDQPDLADDLAPLSAEQISSSTHDAELAFERLMGGLQFSVRKDMVFEDYAIVWLKDLAITVQRALTTNSGDAAFIGGLQNVAQHIQQFIQMMGQNDSVKEKAKQMADALSQIMNHVKSLAQRIQEKEQAGNGAGMDETQTKLQGKMMLDQAKAQNMRESHAARTAQRQAAFELDQQRQDRKTEADIRRDTAKTMAEIEAEAISNSAARNREQPPTE